MNRRGFLTSFVTMLAIVAGILVANPTGVRAQIDPCTCRLVPIDVADGTCNVQIRVTRPGETPFLLFMGGGNSVSVACANGIKFELLITGGCWINIGTNCTTGYSVPGGCCVNACLQQSAGGCWSVQIKPHTGKLCLACAQENPEVE